MQKDLLTTQNHIRVNY